jgi:hypothetical protein
MYAPDSERPGLSDDVGHPGSRLRSWQGQYPNAVDSRSRLASSHSLILVTKSASAPAGASPALSPGRGGGITFSSTRSGATLVSVIADKLRW